MTELFECAQVERRARSDFLDAPFNSWTNSNAINQNWTHLSFSLISMDFLCHASMDLELLGDPQAPTWRRLVVERRKTFALAEKKNVNPCSDPNRNSGEIMLHLWIGKTYICISYQSYHISTTETCETNLRLYWNCIWNYISESNMWCMVYILDMNTYIYICYIWYLWSLKGTHRNSITPCSPAASAVLLTTHSMEEAEAAMSNFEGEKWFDDLKFLTIRW